MKQKLILILAFVLLLFAFLYFGYAPVREFYRVPEYTGQNNFNYKMPAYDPAKKTILLIGDNKGTELFDLMAPFYLFNLTQRANVYIVAQRKYPINIRKGLYTLPHFTYGEIDSLNIQPSVIVIPRLAADDQGKQDSSIVQWIKSNYTDSTKLLSVCWGSITAGATGLYDGKSLTSHAIRFDNIKKKYPNPAWVKNISVAQTGNLYSTAGVSNAVEGGLTVIRDLFGEELMKALMDSVHYPYPQLKLEHHSVGLSLGINITIAKKIYLQENKTVGVLLQDNMDEFALASVLDTYHRTFPGSIETFSTDGNTVTTKHGLTIIPGGNTISIKNLDELHVLNESLLRKTDQALFGNTVLVKYNSSDKEYLINQCLKRIRQQYGAKFENVVRALLDYN